MAPKFKDNDLILSLKYFRSLKVNDVVLLNIPKIGTVIKRIKSIHDKNIYIQGDNKEYSSENYKNKYEVNDVIGKVFFKF